MEKIEGTKNYSEMQKEQHLKNQRKSEISGMKVPISKPVVVEAEKVSTQKDTVTGSSRPLKRLRKLNPDDKAPTVSPPLKKMKKQRAHRDTVESDSEDEEAAKEGETAQDRVPTPPVSPIIEQVHTDDPGTSAEIDIHNLIVPEVLYLEAPATQLTPPTTPIQDADFNEDVPTTPILNLDDENQILGAHQDLAVDQNLDADQSLEDDVEASIALHTAVLSEDADTAGSISSDTDNAETTGEAATNLDADAAVPSGHAPQQAPCKADLVKKFVRWDAPVPWSETPRGKEWTKEWNTVSFVPSEKILAEHLAKADEMLINDDFKAQLRVTALSTRHLQGQHSTTHAKTLKGKDDKNDDQGNSDKGRGQGQGKGFSSSKARITSQGTSSDTGRRISSDTGMDFESLKEEEARLKVESVKTKSKASVVEKKFPKLKGIVIKETTNSEATKAKSQVEVDPRSKGKEKVDEPVKVYMSVMDKEIIDEEDASLTLMKKNISQTTSNMAHVVQSQDLVSSDMTVKQATSNIAQVDLISEVKEKETSDIAHVKLSKILLPGFTKAQQTQPLKTTSSGFEARVVTGKEVRDKSGLGSSDERRVHNTTNDSTSLSEPGVGATPERLNQLESIQMVYHSVLKEHILLYFMTDGKKKLYSVKSDSPYYPKYRDHKGDIVEMKPNTAKIITTFLGYKAVEFNLESDKAYLIILDQDIRKAKINDLRAAIFQTGEDTAELKNAKRRMVNELEYAERCLLKNYLRTTPDIKEIRN
ncbi:hypothetical protein AgCh_005225 [Apium graveolens]